MITKAHEKMQRQRNILKRGKKEFHRKHPGLWQKLLNASLYASIEDPCAAAGVWCALYRLEANTWKPRRGAIIYGHSQKIIKTTLQNYKIRKPKKYLKKRKRLQGALERFLFFYDDTEMESALDIFYPDPLMLIFQKRATA